MSNFLKAFEPSVLLEKSFLRSAILVVFLMLSTLWATYLSALQLANANAARFELQQENLSNSIEHALETSEQVLKGARALFFSSDLVEADEWAGYFSSLRLKENFRGLQGIGYALWIRDNDMEAFNAEMKAMGIGKITVYPAASRDPQSAIIYLEPKDTRNSKAIGYDMWSEATRRAAMEEALKTGEPQLSGKVRLVQEIDNDIQAGFLIYLPFYGKGQRPTTPAEREASIKGFIYAPFRADNFINAALGDDDKDIAVTIYDGKTVSPETVLYKSHLPTLSPSQRLSMMRGLKTIHFRGGTWTVEFMALPSFSAQQSKLLPIVILSGGGILSLLVFFLSWAMASAKLRAQQLAKDSSSLFKFMIQHTPAAVAMFDRDMRYISYSDRWVKDYGLEGRHLMGQSHYDVFPEIREFRPEWIEAHKRALNGAVLFSEKDTLERPDGSIEYLRYEVRPWRDGSGHIGGIVMFTESITDQVRAIEEIKNSAAELERFAFIASHDLKTPLRGIDNLAKWLEEDLGGKVSDDIHDKLKLMRGRVRRMESLLDDI
ncbi:MAG: CHASE domain-containing protein, partial [Pseudobdellovibrionaceae bacterium]